MGVLGLRALIQTVGKRQPELLIPMALVVGGVLFSKPLCQLPMRSPLLGVAVARRAMEVLQPAEVAKVGLVGV